MSQVGEVERVSELRTLIRLLAARSGQLLKPAALGNEIGVPHSTVARYLYPRRAAGVVAAADSAGFVWHQR